MPISTLLVSHAASLWYPIMLAQERGEISEAKAAELLGLRIDDYRDKREKAIASVMQLVTALPSPLTSLLEVIMDRPQLFAATSFASSSIGKENESDCS